MEMRTGRVAGAAHRCNQLPFLDIGSAGEQGSIQQMGIEGLPAIIMIHHDQIAISPVGPARINDHTGVCGKNWAAKIPVKIQAIMHGWSVVIPRKPGGSRWPGKGAGAHVAVDDSAARARSKIGIARCRRIACNDPGYSRPLAARHDQHRPRFNAWVGIIPDCVRV